MLEEPEVEALQELGHLSTNNYLIVLLIGHGPNKDGTQIFQLQEEVFVRPRQIQFECKKQLHIL